MSSTYNALTNAIILNENSSYANNPGALMDATTGQPLQFPNLQAGIDALNAKIGFDLSGKSSVYSPNETLAQFEYTYTGGDPNAANNVASMLEVSPSAPVGSLTDSAVAPKQSFWQRVQNWFSNYGQNLSQGTINDPLSPNTALAESAGKTPQQVFQNPQSSGFSNVAIDATSVLLGLILIAIAVFGLSKVQETVVTAAKSGAKLAVA